MIQIHLNRDLLACVPRQHQLAHRANMHAASAHVRAFLQAHHVSELGLHLIRGLEKVLLTADDEDAKGKHNQRDDDKGAQARNSRHKFSYEYLRKSLTNGISLCLRSSKLPSITTRPLSSSVRRSAMVRALCM